MNRGLGSQAWYKIAPSMLIPIILEGRHQSSGLNQADVVPRVGGGLSIFNGANLEPGEEGGGPHKKGSGTHDDL
jgi:hypothetical protein